MNTGRREVSKQPFIGANTVLTFLSHGFMRPRLRGIGESESRIDAGVWICLRLSGPAEDEVFWKHVALNLLHCDSI